MKKLLIVTLTLLVACVMVFSACAEPAPTPAPTPTPAPAPSPTPAPPEVETVILKLSVAIPPGDPMVEGLKPWIEDFNAAANGRYEMQLFEGGQLAGTMDTLDAVRNQVVEIGHGSMPLYGGQHPAIQAAQVPYMINNYEANYEFIQLIRDYQNEILMNQFDQNLLAAWSMGFNELYTVDTPVKTMEDLKGLNIAVTAPIMGQAAQSLGASPVTMDWPDEIPSLEKGVVDGGMATVAGAMAFMAYWELVDYYIASSLFGGELCITMNLDVFNAMPADLQQVMLDEAREYQEAMNIAMKDFSFVWAMGELEKNGVDIYVLPPEERARWKDACGPIAEDYWELMGEDAQFLKDAADQANAKFPYGG